MDSEVLTQIVILITAVASICTPVYLFFVQKNLDIKEILARLETLSKAPPPESAQPQVEPGSLKSKIMKFFDDRRAEVQQNLASESKRVDIYHFDKGWLLLFDDFFDSPTEPVLRDFTLSSHGELTFGSYEFSTYPGIIRERLGLLRAGHPFQIKMMILCDHTSKGKCNAAAESYFEQLITLKFPELQNASKIEKINRWRESGMLAAGEVEIRLSNGILADRLATMDPYLFEAPFNVYGSRAASVSIVKPKGYSRPVPHLQILLNSADVEKYKRYFELLWKESVSLQKKMLADVTDSDLEKLGSGELFTRWSSVQP